MKRSLTLVLLLTLLSFSIQAQKHKEAEYDKGVILIDKNYNKTEQLVSDTAYESHSLFIKTKVWAKKSFNKVYVSPNERTVTAENDYISVIFYFNYKDVGSIQFAFTDKGDAGNLPFGANKKQRIIDDLSQYLHASNQVVSEPLDIQVDKNN